MTPEALESALVSAAWHAGDLRYLLYPLQDEWNAQYEATRGRFVIECSRRIGKSVFVIAKAFECALRKPGAKIPYAAPTGKMVKEIIVPTIHEVFLPECPAALRPKHNKTDGTWEFGNGSRIRIAGVNNGHADDLRGASADLAIVDEAGFVDDLGYLIKDVLGPQLLTTRGRMIVPSSPARSPGHEFTTICDEAELRGNLVRATIYDALDNGHPSLTAEAIEEFAAEVGGKDTTTWQREYEARRVVDEEGAIVPEFTALEPELVEAFERPEYFKGYVIGDNGFVDLAFWLFVTHDFERNLLLVEDELVFRHATAEDMAIPMRAKEVELWGDQAPTFRLADAQPQALAEFARLPAPYPVGKAPNDELDATVNALRIATKQKRYRVHPRCRQLRLHLRNGIWNKAHTKFDRMDGYGHFDGIAALMYAWRCVPRSINPYPDIPADARRSTHHIPQVQHQSSMADLGSKWRRRR